jgi:hypothetical protein
MSDVKNIIYYSRSHEPQDKVNKEEIGNWTILSYESGVYEFIGPRHQVIFLASNTPEAEKRAVFKILPKYVRHWFNKKNQ